MSFVFFDYIIYTFTLYDVKARGVMVSTWGINPIVQVRILASPSSLCQRLSVSYGFEIRCL